MAARSQAKPLVGGTLRYGLSLAEMLATIAIIGIVAIIILPRIGDHANASKVSTCYTLKGNIEIQARLWFRNKGVWPAGDLSDIGADTHNFPEGISNCPVDGTSYSLDPTTHLVLGHVH